MKIISGKWKGKNLIGYDIDGTRPTQDRVKESLFAMIQNDILESTILDLFAGSGNLGLEALSNGAKESYFVDNNRNCIEVLKKNLDKVEKMCYHILKNDYQEALVDFKKNNIKFDIIFLDPPYKLTCLDKIITFIIKNDLLKEEGLIICEYEQEQFQETYPSLALEKERKYGYKNIRIYRKESL